MPTQDFLAKAARTSLRPAVARHGFQQYSPKAFFRLCGKIVQFVDLQKSGWGGGNFAVNYFIFILVPHRKFIGSIFAGRFPRGKSGDGWWKSVPEEAAEESMQEVCSIFESFALPILDESMTLSGYATALRKHCQGAHSGHASADMGIALICDGKIEEGHRLVRKAEVDYRAFSAQFPGMKEPLWSDECADQMARLSSAVEAGTHETLIEEWFQQSILTLKIDKKWKNDKKG